MAKIKSISHEQLVNDKIKDLAYSSILKEFVSKHGPELIRRIIPAYSLINQAHKDKLLNKVMQELGTFKTSLNEACDLECDDDSGCITFKAFEEALNSLDIFVT